MHPVVKLLRPHQYLKNGFVLIGVFFAHEWNAQALTSAGIIFVAFCCIASAVYILNDIFDIEADRAHPVKSARPLPSGQVSLRFAQAMLLSLLAAAVALSLRVGSWAFGFVAAYFILNVLYSIRLKHVVILDVFIISSGFMLRILAGTLGIGIEPSRWLLLCGLMITLFLGFAKRRSELLVLENTGATPSQTRKVLDDYSPIMLEQFISVTAACTILSYGLYTVSPETVSRHGGGNLIYTLPFVVYGIFRYLFLLHRYSKGNDTAKDILTDRHILLTIFAWGCVTAWLLA